MNLLSLFTLTVFLMAMKVSASEAVVCKGISAVQAGAGLLPQESELRFTLERAQKPKYLITNLNGYFNVKTPFLDGDKITPDNGYRGQFTIASMNSDTTYRPRKYKGWVRFKNLDATSTEGLEHGMWGDLVLDVSKGDEFEARYIFQAGFHMGGTLRMSCQSE